MITITFTGKPGAGKKLIADAIEDLLHLNGISYGRQEEPDVIIVQDDAAELVSKLIRKEPCTDR